MPKIRCAYEDCIFLEKGFCSTVSIEIDPEDGCLTYSEDPNDINIAEFETDEFEDDDSWDDEGYQELDTLELEGDDDF